VALVTVFALAAVATAAIICQCRLADETPRGARQRVEVRRLGDAAADLGIERRDGWADGFRRADDGAGAGADLTSEIGFGYVE
jgi:hypothetical protein